MSITTCTPAAKKCSFSCISRKLPKWEIEYFQNLLYEVTLRMCWFLLMFNENVFSVFFVNIYQRRKSGFRWFGNITLHCSVNFKCTWLTFVTLIKTILHLQFSHKIIYEIHYNRQVEVMVRDIRMDVRQIKKIAKFSFFCQLKSSSSTQIEFANSISARVFANIPGLGHTNLT